MATLGSICIKVFRLYIYLKCIRNENFYGKIQELFFDNYTFRFSLAEEKT